MKPIFILWWSTYQISANRGPDWRFDLEVNIKALISKPNSSRVIKLMDRGWVTRPRGKYQVENTILELLGKLLLVFYTIFRIKVKFWLESGNKSQIIISQY